jgi:modification methylase
MKFPEDFINKIICGDSLEIMKQMPDECLDLVVTSPPYNLHIRKTFNNTENWKGKWNKSKLQSEGYDKHSDYMPEDKYTKWQQESLKECFRLIKDDGAIFYNHKWRVQNGLYQQRLNLIEGLPLRQIIIWKKFGGINFNEGYFLPTYEVIYLIAKPKFKLAPKVNRYGDVWTIKQENTSWHPAAFPLELASKCVEATRGNLILDPFVGSGTVPVACKQQNKNYIGIDISENYCKKAEERISNI